jgi:carboxyl-terminal processing protease
VKPTSFPNTGIRWFARTGAVLLAGWALAATAVNLPPEQRQLELDSFELVWTTLRDQHFDATFGGLDWQGVHDELRLKIESALTREETSRILRDLAHRLGQSHVTIIPAELSASTAGSDDTDDAKGGSGLEARVIETCALVIKVDPGSPAETAGVRPGWEIVRIRQEDVPAQIARFAKELQGHPQKDLILSGELGWALRGKVGERLALRFIDGKGETVDLAAPLAEPRGQLFQLGHCPPVAVWIETRILGTNIGYIAFNAFMDPVRLMPTFNETMEHAIRDRAKGVILDLRGNTGGMGAMVMGMGGWFLNAQEGFLGTLHLRTNELKHIVWSRPQLYRGPVAVLVDTLSLCGSEVLAAGLRENGRGRIFGTRTGGVARAGSVMRLPNGDLFMFAMADFRTRNGQRIKGVGVTPDVEANHTRESLLAGRDVMLEAALNWILTQDNDNQTQERK